MTSPKDEGPEKTRARLAVASSRLRRRCDPDSLPFLTTAELEADAGLLGQQRAADALEFAVAMKGRGYNAFVAGEPGSGRTMAVRAYLNVVARRRPTPPDWCYVHNFRDPTRPRVLRLASGQGRKLRSDMKKLVTAARREIPRAFESEEYVAHREEIVNGLNHRREQALTELSGEAQESGFMLRPTAMGFAIAPVLGKRPLTNEDLATLRPEMREEIEKRREALDARIRAFLKDARLADRETREELERQDRDVALHAVGGIFEDLLEAYSGQPEVSEHLADVKEGILADIGLFRSHPLASDSSLPEPTDSANPEHVLHERSFRKYEVNVFVDNGDTAGAPVVMEANPTHPNLVGRVEREAVFGALLTDFSLIGSGALHRANGGFLVCRALDVLRAPFAWEALKRSLRDGNVTIEDATEALGFGGTRSLRPDPIPLDCKVVLIGAPQEFELLYLFDPDFRELFKVRVDFDPELPRTSESELAYARFVRACTPLDGKPFDRTAVARLIEESSRIVADQRKLSARYRPVADLVEESIHYAELAGSDTVQAEHVRQAVEKRRARAALVPERYLEAVERGILLIRPTGLAIGEINGLAVVGDGGHAFGRPSRITASVGVGRDGLIDIERQSELSGRIHNKGVLILGGFLNDRYARDKPLTVSARLVFEQSYGEVEGDSASLAELLALLSVIAESPLDQGIAVTGSVNQKGDVQAVGGVDEKVEGFFDVCKAQGLTGGQGVVLPESNLQHLMLREEVVEAVAAGSFSVWGVRSVDEAIEILTGQPAAAIHDQVKLRLHSLAETLRKFASPGEASSDGRQPKATRSARKAGSAGHEISKEYRT